MHPTDNELSSIFLSNKKDFETLARMLSEDKNIVILTSDSIFYESDSPKKISLERLNNYRSLMKKLGVKNGVHRDNEDKVQFVMSANNYLLSPIGNSAKSIVYATDSVSPLVDSLDEVQNKREQKPIFKKIENNWYLSYESW